MVGLPDSIVIFIKIRVIFTQFFSQCSKGYFLFDCEYTLNVHGLYIMYKKRDNEGTTFCSSIIRVPFYFPLLLQLY